MRSPISSLGRPTPENFVYIPEPPPLFRAQFPNVPQTLPSVNPDPSRKDFFARLAAWAAVLAVAPRFLARPLAARRPAAEPRVIAPPVTIRPDGRAVARPPRSA